mmetsp:Transcript_37231/g.109940  ORF Transcript_37231/g.109940 Transcript_37231/m.109940 type:complete len:86 (-) Transcript_37231:1035-1292(-)|eukprot:359936-Chlamydomonas_euryale.AAC.2
MRWASTQETREASTRCEVGGFKGVLKVQVCLLPAWVVGGVHTLNMYQQMFARGNQDPSSAPKLHSLFVHFHFSENLNASGQKVLS